ncbi:hypothetical protein D3C76_1106980 [compost metagenome]
MQVQVHVKILLVSRPYLQHQRTVDYLQSNHTDFRLESWRIDPTQAMQLDIAYCGAQY